MAFIRDGLTITDIMKFHDLPDFLAPAAIPKFIDTSDGIDEIPVHNSLDRRYKSSKIVTLFRRAIVPYILLFFGRLAISFAAPTYARTRLEVLRLQPGPTKFSRAAPLHLEASTY